MTEERWLAAGHPGELIHFVREQGDSVRKLRLFAVECVRSIEQHLPDKGSRRALAFAERNADRAFRSLRYRRQAENAAHAALNEAVVSSRAAADPDEYGRRKVREDAAYAAQTVVAADAWVAAVQCSEFAAHVFSWAALETCESRAQAARAGMMEAVRRGRNQVHADLLRDIFGNPFRPVAFDPALRTDTTVSLAKHMYEIRDFGAMPILADALQDAGCENEDVLEHCRKPDQVHVRGCWVVDLVLGKA